MANSVNPACKYLIVETGYVGRLLIDDHPDEIIEEDNKSMIDFFSDFCNNKDVIPLFIHEKKTTTIIAFRDWRIDLNSSISEDENKIANAIVNSIMNPDRGQLGFVVFQVPTFEHAKEVFLHIQDLDYCYCGSICDIQFLRDDVNDLDMIYVNIDCESG